MSRHRKRLLVWLALVLGCLTVAAGFGEYSHDDNFITYRYASNWAQGLGLVYNEGEAVFGTSAPGYALLLGMLDVVPWSPGIPLLGTCIALASILVLVWTLGTALEARGEPGVSAVMAAFGALALTSRFNLYLLGSETYATAALCVLAVVAMLARDQPILAGALVGAAGALRLDALLVLPVLCAVSWRPRRRSTLVFIASAAAVTAVWAVVLLSLFGTLVPNTLGGKAAIREVAYTLQQGRFLVLTATPFGAFGLIALALAGAAEVVQRGWARTPAVLTIAGWLLTTEVAYRVAGVWFAPWYHVATFQTLLALAAIGATVVARRVGGAPMLAAVMVVVTMPSLVWIARHWGAPPAPGYERNAWAGEVLRGVTSERSVLAMEIGVVGHATQARILDMGGLVSPEFTAAKFRGDRAQLAARLRPDFIVDAQSDLIDEVLRLPAIADGYLVMAERTFTGSGPVRILARRDLERQSLPER